jgi:hypothetical protein
VVLEAGDLDGRRVAGGVGADGGEQLGDMVIVEAKADLLRSRRPDTRRKRRSTRSCSRSRSA